MASSFEARVQAVLAWLQGHATQAMLEGMSRYAIPSDHAYGVAMKDIKPLGKTLGCDHELALALWRSRVYEARMLASFVGDPARLTPTQMDRWCKDFDNWAFCDALSFNLFDRTPHAWAKLAQWSASPREFERRTAFALLWSLSVHDKQPPTRPSSTGWRWSNAKSAIRAPSSRRPSTWRCARSANATAHCTPRRWRWRGARPLRQTPRQDGSARMRCAN